MSHDNIPNNIHISTTSSINYLTSTNFINLISELKKNVPIIKRIPKGARTILAGNLSKRIHIVLYK